MAGVSLAFARTQDISISFFYLFPDPIGEDVIEDSSYDIANPFSTDLVKFSAVWQIAADLVGVQPAKLLDLLQRE